MADRVRTIVAVTLALVFRQRTAGATVGESASDTVGQQQWLL